MESSLFKKLPLELRLDIYERALHIVGFVKVTLNTTCDEVKRIRKEKRIWAKERPPKRNQQKNLMSITATCKEIARETAGIVFAVNDSWTFVHPEDNSADWGKRVREWSKLAKHNHLHHLINNVQFDLGVFIARKAYDRQFDPMDIPNEAAALFLNLPKSLRRPAINHTIKVTLNWTRGVRLTPEWKDQIGPCYYALPMFGSEEEIEAAIREPARKESAHLRALMKEWEIKWPYGIPFTLSRQNSVEFDDQEPRVWGDMHNFRQVAIQLEKAMKQHAEVFGAELREKKLEW